MTTKKIQIHPRFGRLLSVLTLLAFNALPLWADTVFVTARTAASGVTAYPPYLETPAWGSSGGASTVPELGSLRVGSRFCQVTDRKVAIQPTLAHAGEVYKLWITVPASANNTTLAVIMLANSTNAVLSFPETTAFQQGVGGNTWAFVGYITNNAGVSNPWIEFSVKSGTYTDIGSRRLYADGFMLQWLGDVCAGVPEVTIPGNVGSNMTSLAVVSVLAAATNVAVYQDSGSGMVKIGQKTSGIVAGSNNVPVTGLIQGAVVSATQTTNGIESCVKTTGPIVGGGATPRIRISLAIRQPGGLTGPIGANGGTTGSLYIKKCTGWTGGFAGSGAPIGGQVLEPGICWQTVTVTPSDPTFNFVSATLPDPNQYGTLDSIDFCMDDLTNTGPYEIYIDNFRNGSTVIQNFEGLAQGAHVLFDFPRVSGSTNPNLLDAPNGAGVSTNNAAGGTNSCLVTFQFKNLAAGNWVRMTALFATGPNPELDLTQDISFDVLVLPVNVSQGQNFVGTVGNITNSTPPTYPGVTNTFGVTVTGAGTYTYQWTWSGGALPNPTTDRTYMIDGAGSGASTADDGTYTVAVSDGTCTQTRSITFSVTPPLPVITNQPVNAILQDGSTAVAMSVVAGVPHPSGLPLSYEWRKDGGANGQTDAALSFPSGVQSTDAGDYEVVVSNTSGSVTSSVARLSVTTAAPGSGTGLTGAYYTLHTNDNPFTGSPTHTQLDPFVNFAWAIGASPAAGVSDDYFTARWYGQVQAVGDDTYTFYTVSDDGVRLWVNGQLMVNQWVLHPPWTNSSTIALTGTTKYNLVMEYFENASSAAAKLYWSKADASVQYSYIPTSQLYPLTFVPPTATLTSPADMTTNSLPATVTLTATVTTNNAQEVNGVQFLTNGVLLTTVATSPYNYSWVNPPTGTFAVTAKVLYDVSVTTDASNTRTVTLVPTPVSVSGPGLGLVGNSLNYSGGGGSRFVLVKSADIAAAMNTWTRVATNTVTPGSFTIPVGSAAAAYYRVKSE